MKHFDLSEVAKHNDEAHGYWMIVAGVVYDVTNFMCSHPGGPRILQLYAGRDATAGFRRVHSDGSQLSALLARTRHGLVRELCCYTEAEHASHAAAARKLQTTLHLIVEMQNALAADHALELAPLHPARPGRSRYELQRSVETHLRFQREYLEVIMSESVPALASLILSRQAEGDLLARLQQLRAATHCVRARAEAVDVFERLERYSNAELTRYSARFELIDTWILSACKHELSRALGTLEAQHEAKLQPDGAENLNAVCERLLGRLEHYFQRACAVLTA